MIFAPMIHRLSQRVPLVPHRGIETIIYVLAGEVEHGDSHSLVIFS
jgi:redox-sensitive bicupin YhaK (pirin superfamily)